jgi:hypothetical protein
MSRRENATLLEGVGELLVAAAQLGLLSGAAAAAAFGNLLLALVFCAVAAGIFLRFKRGRA